MRVSCICCMLRGVWVIARCLPVCGEATASDPQWVEAMLLRVNYVNAERERLASMCTHFLLYMWPLIIQCISYDHQTNVQTAHAGVVACAN